MRRIAAALVALLAVGCDSSSSGEMCEQPEAISRPNGIEIEGALEDKSHCQVLVACLVRDDCSSEGCAMSCAAEMYGSADCGCCGPDCDDACDAVLDLSVATLSCFNDPECSSDEHQALVTMCEASSVPGTRTVP